MSHFIELTDEGMAPLWVSTAHIVYVEPVPQGMDTKARAVVHLADGSTLWVREACETVAALVEAGP